LTILPRDIATGDLFYTVRLKVQRVDHSTRDTGQRFNEWPVCHTMFRHFVILNSALYSTQVHSPVGVARYKLVGVFDISFVECRQ